MGDYPTEASPTAPPGPHASSDVWIVRPDGSDWHRVIAAGGGGPGPWSPDGRHLVVPISGDDRVVVADIDAGTEVRHVLANATTADWSPDGQELVVGSLDSDNGDARTVTIVDARTGATRTLIDGGDAPTWSPNGDWIATAVIGRPGITLVRPDGHVGPTLNGLGGPAWWSSDGRSLAYVDAASNGITVADVDGETITTRPTVAEPQVSRTSDTPGGWVPGTRLLAVLAVR